MRSLLLILVLLFGALLPASRCDVPGELGPCKEYRKSCNDSLGGCCWDNQECVPSGCVYRGRDTSLGASPDAGPAVEPRWRP